MRTLQRQVSESTKQLIFYDKTSKCLVHRPTSNVIHTQEWKWHEKVNLWWCPSHSNQLGCKLECKDESNHPLLGSAKMNMDHVYAFPNPFPKVRDSCERIYLHIVGVWITTETEWTIAKA